MSHPVLFRRGPALPALLCAVALATACLPIEPPPPKGSDGGTSGGGGSTSQGTFELLGPEAAEGYAIVDSGDAYYVAGLVENTDASPPPFLARVDRDGTLVSFTEISVPHPVIVHDLISTPDGQLLLVGSAGLPDSAAYALELARDSASVLWEQTWGSDAALRDYTAWAAVPAGAHAVLLGEGSPYASARVAWSVTVATDTDPPKAIGGGLVTDQPGGTESGYRDGLVLDHGSVLVVGGGYRPTTGETFALADRVDPRTGALASIMAATGVCDGFQRVVTSAGAIYALGDKLVDGEADLCVARIDPETLSAAPGTVYDFGGWEVLQDAAGAPDGTIVVSLTTTASTAKDVLLARIDPQTGEILKQEDHTCAAASCPLNALVVTREGQVVATGRAFENDPDGSTVQKLRVISTAL